MQMLGIRFLILAAYVAPNAAAIYFRPQPDLVIIGLSVLAGFVPALGFFRNLWLALAVVLAPLPGVLGFGVSAYALCVGVGLVLAAALVEADLGQENRRAALNKILIPIAAMLLLGAAWSIHTPVQLAGLIGTSAATVVFVPLLVLILPFGEEFIARANRRREILQRFSAGFARIAEARWCFSLSGAGLVLAVLGWFEIAIKPRPFDMLAAAGVAAILLVLTRDLRAGLGALAAAALVVLFTGGVDGSLLLFLFFASLLGARQKEVGAWARALEGHAAMILFAGLASVLTAIPQDGPRGALHGFYGVAAALILFPAFSGALLALLPRRRSVEELYGSSAS